MRLRRVVAAALLLAVAPLARAAAPPALSLQGNVAHPAMLTAAQLRRLPPTTVASRFGTEHGTEQATYTGALLWTLLQDAGPVDAPGRRTFLQHTVVVRGQDGYAVALAIGEIDPDFEGKPVILAYARDGKPQDSVRLVVPGDRRGGRNVRGRGRHRPALTASVAYRPPSTRDPIPARARGTAKRLRPLG